MKYKERIGSAAATLATLVSGTLLLGAVSAQAVRSPTGVSWDCLISGTQGVGVSYVNFYDDGTLDGMAIMRPNYTVPAPSPTADPNVRNSGDISRTGTDGRTGTTTPTTGTTTTSSSAAASGLALYGYGPVRGYWNYDPYGRVIGAFYQIIAGSGEGTNAAPAVTNSIGFKAICVPYQRLTMMAYMPGGRRALFTGIPMKDYNVVKLNSLTESSWVGAQSGTGDMPVEFFNLAPSWQPGAYTLSGTGATYNVDGYAILSARGRIGFSMYSNGQLRATVGLFSRRTSKALTLGVLEPSSWVRFNAYQYPIVTPPAY